MKPKMSFPVRIAKIQVVILILEQTASLPGFPAAERQDDKMRIFKH